MNETPAIEVLIVENTGKRLRKLPVDPGELKHA
jgi:hypothetical protein